jgi:succinate dehydrogenase/fumarate reductase flavoprotein subunit
MQWAVEELEKLGVPMRWDDGEFITEELIGRRGLRVHWQNVKPQMAAAVRKRGVSVLERTMVVELLVNNDRVVGATAIDTRTGEFIIIKAYATIIATAACSRIYNPETPMPWKYKFRYHWCPASVSGDGWAMAYRAGAELANMEQAERGYRFRDDLVLSFGNYRGGGISAKRLTWDGEEFSNPQKLAEMEQKGKDPFYYSLEHLPDDFQKRIEVAYVDERLISFKIAEDRGFNPRTHRYEMMDARPNQLNAPPGIHVDGDFKTTLKGLYAIGDCMAGSHAVVSAATSGFLIGDSIHTFVSDAGEPVIDEAQVKGQKETTLAPLTVKDGTEAMELECAIRYICDRYVGLYKSEGKLREGLRRLGTLRRVFLPRLVAKNPHYLMRCLEIRNLMDMAELHMHASLERRETRGSSIRLDYPNSNPELDGLFTYQWLENRKPVFEMRKLKPIAYADDHKEER